MNICFNHISQFITPKCPIKSNSAYYLSLPKFNQLACDTISFTGKAKRLNELTESETMKKLFTPEFTPKRRINEDGYLVTTVIDKTTDKPAEIYIKKVDCDEENNEKYVFYEKAGKNYKEIGYRLFETNSEDNIITIGYMKSKERDKYAGLGIRGHQLAIERMIELGFENIEVMAIPGSFPFHYKCGFRPIENDTHPIKETTGDINQLLNEYSKKWNVPKDIIRKYLKYEIIDGKINSYLVNAIGKISEHYYLNNKAIPNEMLSPPMMLTRDSLNKWQKRIESQPILLGLE